MKSKMTPKHKLMAYVLNREYGYSMKKIGELMNVAQSTISKAVNEAEYWVKINNLQQELYAARQELIENGFEPPKIFNQNPIHFLE